MITKLMELISTNRTYFYSLLNHLSTEKSFLLPGDIQNLYLDFTETYSGKSFDSKVVDELFKKAQLGVVKPPRLYFAVRPDAAEWTYLCFHINDVFVEEISISEFLAIQENIDVQNSTDDYPIEIDLSVFNRDRPKLRHSKNIGQGVSFLNRHLSSQLFSNSDDGKNKLFQFLKIHRYNEMPLMLNDRIKNIPELISKLKDTLKLLAKADPAELWSDLKFEMQSLGFEAGWGRTVQRISESMNLLIDILEGPDPSMVADFLGRIPMIFNILIVSPHGYFSQSDVLGLPDTGGQIIYILDQVKALEEEMVSRLHNQGLDIKPKIVVLTRLIPEAHEQGCDIPIENINGTENVKILRVPFKNEMGNPVPQWISRFKVWPYLEQFALDSEEAVKAEFGSKPDFIIGNYSDGNLVATLMAKNLGVTQCNIAHALEKTKYLFSDIYWKDYEKDYHFGAQFTADMIAMNSADFIITSTYQEIAGNEKSSGQYESYSSFTMPDLYRIISGIDVYDTKFNIVSPGSDPEIYFPYFNREKRLFNLIETIEEMIFGKETKDNKGYLKNPEKPVLFLISRLDKVKNITGFITLYGKSKELQDLVNVFVIAGNTNVENSQDAEEIEQIKIMHQLYETYDLYNNVRWVNKITDRNLVGEIYRFVADRKGAFIQPALFEAFGLTVIEAMISGLPVFATNFGGPLEIIEDKKSGYHINPTAHEETAKLLIDFFTSSTKSNFSLWESISESGIKRIQENFTWKLYAEKLMSQAYIYSYWKYVSNLERKETQQVLDLIYGLVYRKLAKQVK